MPPRRTANKKTYYAIQREGDEKAGLFFGGYDQDGNEVFRAIRYSLYDVEVAKKKVRTMDAYPRLNIVVSPVQNEREAWGEEPTWRR